MRSAHGRPPALSVVRTGHRAYLCIAQSIGTLPTGQRSGPQEIDAMIPLLIHLFRRPRRYVWRPEVDLRDRHVAATLSVFPES